MEVKCKPCGETFQSQEDLKKHILEEHFKEKK